MLMDMQLERAAPPAPPERRQSYVSMFRINGAPILPPLMTNEKRRQMRQIKEQAMEIEKLLQLRKEMRLNNAEEAPSASSSAQTAGSSDMAYRTASESSMDSNKFAKMQQDSMEDSYQQLTKLVESVEALQCNRSFPADSCECPKNCWQKRMLKLQKSETIIFDIGLNVVTPAAGITEPLIEEPPPVAALALEAAGDGQVAYKTASNDSLHAPKQIPAICINPPTPIVAVREFPDSTNATHNSTGNLSDISDMSHDSSQHSSIVESELEQQPRKAYLPPRRSATSPSLKPAVAHNEPATTAAECDIPLVRSNSFTLEGPSEALLAHTRKQKAAAVAAAAAEAQLKRGTYTVSKTPDTPSSWREILTNNCAAAEAVASPKSKRDTFVISRTTNASSARRDTVESKAKRVQKVELKPRLPNMCTSLNPPKGMSSSYSSASTAGSSKTTVLNSLRSPYDAVSTRGTPKKTASAHTSTSQTKQRSNTTAGVTFSNNNNNITLSPKHSHKFVDRTAKSPNNNVHANRSQPNILHEIETQQNRKFMHLLIMQREEQKRLKDAYALEEAKILSQQQSKNSNKMQAWSPSTPRSGRRSSFESVSPRSSSFAMTAATTTSLSSSMTSANKRLPNGSAHKKNTSPYKADSLSASSKNTPTPRRRLFSGDSTARSSDAFISTPTKSGLNVSPGLGSNKRRVLH